MPRDVTITSPYQGLYPKGLLPEHSFWKQTEGMFTGKRGIIISAWALRCLFCWDGFARPEVVERSNVSELHAFFICHPNFCVLFCSGELLQSVSFRNFITQPYVAGNRVVLLRVFSAFHCLGGASAPALFMLFPTRKKPKDVL